MRLGRDEVFVEMTRSICADLQVRDGEVNIATTRSFFGYQPQSRRLILSRRPLHMSPYRLGWAARGLETEMPAEYASTRPKIGGDDEPTAS